MTTCRICNNFLRSYWNIATNPANNAVIAPKIVSKNNTDGAYQK